METKVIAYEKASLRNFTPSMSKSSVTGKHSKLPLLYAGKATATQDGARLRSQMPSLRVMFQVQPLLRRCWRLLKKRP